MPCGRVDCCELQWSGYLHIRRAHYCLTTSGRTVAGGVLRERPMRISPSMMTMPIPGRSPLRILSRRSRPAECCARSKMTKSAARPGSTRPQLRRRARAVLPVAKQNACSVGTSPMLQRNANNQQDPERLNATAGGQVRTEYDALSLTQPDRSAHGVQRRQFIAGMTILDRGARSVRERHLTWSSGKAVWPPLMTMMAASTSGSLRARRRRNQSRTGDGWASGMDRALETVGARPAHHFFASGAVLTPPRPISPSILTPARRGHENPSWVVHYGATGAAGR